MASKLPADPFGFALPLERAIPLLVTIGLTVFNLQFETKDDNGAIAAKWGLASIQFLIIILLLFKNNTYLLGGTVFLSLISILPAYYRFKDHENVRLSYIITQGLVSLGIIGLTLYHVTHRSKQFTIEKNTKRYNELMYTQQLNRDMIFATNKSLEKARQEDKDTTQLDQALNKAEDALAKSKTETEDFLKSVTTGQKFANVDYSDPNDLFSDSEVVGVSSDGSDMSLKDIQPVQVGGVEKRKKGKKRR